MSEEKSIGYRRIQDAAAEDPETEILLKKLFPEVFERNHHVTVLTKARFSRGACVIGWEGAFMEPYLEQKMFKRIIFEWED